jgi:hypothetical protein
MGPWKRATFGIVVMERNSAFAKSISKHFMATVSVET